MTRASKKQKMLRRRRVSLLLILLIVLASGAVFASKMVTNHKLKKHVEDKFKDEIIAAKDNKEFGETKTKLDYDKNKILAIHYPKVGQKNMDKDIEKLVEKYAEDFKKANKDYEALGYEDMKSLHIDYDAYQYKDGYKSLKLKVRDNEGKETIENLVYDVKEDKQVELKDLFIEDSLSYISSQALGQLSQQEEVKEALSPEIQESLKNEISNYSNFILKNDGIEFYLDKLENQPIKLAYEDLEMYAKYNLDSLERLSQEEIEEKIELAQRGNRIRPGLDPKKPMVALTYDDGPSSKITGPILDQLKKYNSAATFFVLGQNAKVNPEMINRMADEGHEIGNHSYSHKQLTKLSVEELNKEINDTQAVIRDTVGFEPSLLRPTYGAINDRVKENVPMPLMLWSIDTLDWKYRNADRVTASILNNVKDGDIVLMHDLYESTRDASLRVIPELVNRGYQLVTLTEMYELKGESLEAGGRYTNID